MSWVKTHSNFLAKLLCLAVILATLTVYQTTARGWAEEKAANEAAIAEVEAYNAEILALQEAAESEQESADAADETPTYLDGTYTGSGTGFGGEITVSVTIEGDTITAITIDAADGEDSSYLSTALSIVDDILAAQSAEVDTITGATFSSTGIREAVAAALEQAVISNDG